MWKSVTQDQIDRLAVEAFLPIVLLLNYTQLVYLAMFYWKRRGERRVMLLLFIGTLGTVEIIPLPDPSTTLWRQSTTSLALLLQITIIGYDLNKKFKMRSVMYLTYVAEVLILADLVSILLSCIVVFNPHTLSEDSGQKISNMAENMNLAFTFIFRFYYIGISRGWRSIVKTRKVEVCCYLLFATHEMPFDVLSSASGLNWEFAQVIWHRTTLTVCLLMTARSKIKRHSAAASASTASVNSGREKWTADRLSKGSKGVSLRHIFDGNVSPPLDFIRKSVGRSGRSAGRRNTGPQVCVVAPMKQLDNSQ